MSFIKSVKFGTGWWNLQFHLLYYEDFLIRLILSFLLRTHYKPACRRQVLRIQKLGLKRKSHQQRPAFEHLKSYTDCTNNIAQFRLPSSRDKFVLLSDLFVCIGINNSRHIKQIGLFYMYSWYYITGWTGSKRLFKFLLL